MTDPIIPDRVADELLAGEADPHTTAVQLRGVAGLTAAARQAPSEGELAGMSAAVAAFQGVVTPPVSAPGTSTRSVSYMFNTRIPKRAAVITAITVLAAGTAAAAAAGAVPSFGSSAHPEDVSVTTVEGETSTTADPGTTTTTDGSTTTTTDGSTTTTDGATTTTDVTDDSVLLYPGRDFGLCTAWTHGAPKKVTNPAFSYLVDQAMADAGAAAPADGAAEAEVRATVDTYCDKVIADKKGTDDGDDATDDTEATDDETTETATSVDHTAPSHPSGNGNGKGNGQGKGHGKP